MHIERIKKAIETLKAVQERLNNDDETVRFDMHDWGYISGTCGTTACAAGWIVLDPWHKAQGLDFLCEEDLMPIYGSSTGSDAIALYLGLVYKDILKIFVFAETMSGDQLSDPIGVANELERLLEMHLNTIDT
jgi:hypothetical protein